MSKKKITIIGSGPNSLNALDVILKLTLKKKNKTNISEITLCDENGLFGCGNTHNINLHPSIILNRIAGQIALGSYPFLKFPKKFAKYDYNFMEWLNFKFKVTKNKKYKVEQTDWPARSLYGESLIEKFYDLIGIFKKETNIKISLLNTKVLSIKKKNNTYYLNTSLNNTIKTDKILICTGITKRSEIKNNLDLKLKELFKNSKSEYISDFLSILPNNKFLRKKKNKLNICLVGLGVSSLDIINYFLFNNKKLKVNFFPISRTGLFPFARPIYEKQKNTKKYEHKPIILKYELIKKFKDIFIEDNESKISTFEKSILPCLCSEFYLIYFKKYLSTKNYEKFLNNINNSLKVKIKTNKLYDNADLEIISNKILIDFLKKKIFLNNFYKKNWFSQKIILDNIIENKITFFEIFCNPMLLFKDSKTYKQNYIKFLKWDIDEAAKGNLTSPFKMACDGLWRDVRPLFTFLIDNNTLSKSSYKFFLEKILPIHNRLADGPSLNSVVKIRKLIKKEIIVFDNQLSRGRYKLIKRKNKIFLNFSKKEYSIDLLFYSILQVYKSNFKNDSLIQSLINSKILSINKKYKFGLNLTKNLHPLGPNNTIDKNITFVGPPAEGVKFFHHTLPRPDKKQSIITDIDNWAKEI